MNVLEVRDLRTGFGAHAVLHGVSLDVRPGEIAAILGLNGAGKSVTLKTISGLLSAWSGSVSLLGDDVTPLGAEDRVRRGLAHVLQGRAVFPHLTTAENLRLGGAVVKDRRDAAAAMERIYEIFPRLKERRTTLAGRLSGGEQEMLAVGRALMPSPKLLLIDEASQGLSPKAVEHLFGTLRSVNEGGTTILMVEQNVTFTLGIAHRVMVMQKGQIVYEGASGELDRDRLASLLGIGALLGKRVLAGERAQAALATAASEVNLEAEREAGDQVPLPAASSRSITAAPSRKVSNGRGQSRPAAASTGPVAKTKQSRDAPFKLVATPVERPKLVSVQATKLVPVKSARPIAVRANNGRPRVGGTAKVKVNTAKATKVKLDKVKPAAKKARTTPRKKK